jgi:hypothetical protein
MCAEHAPAITTAAELEIEISLFISRVHKVVSKHTPNTRPSPYKKAWWDGELAMLRYEYTPLRNRSMNGNKNEDSQPQLNAQATIARRGFHAAIWAKEKNHWETFLEDSINIWKVAGYPRSAGSGSGDIPLSVITKEKSNLTEKRLQCY